MRSYTPYHLGISNRIYEMMRALNGRGFTTRQIQFVIVNYHKDVHNNYSTDRVASIVAEVLRRAADDDHFQVTKIKHQGRTHNVYSREPDYGAPATPAEKAEALKGFIEVGYLTAEDIYNTPWKSAQDKVLTPVE